MPDAARQCTHVSPNAREVVVFGCQGGGAVVAQSIWDIENTAGRLSLLGFLDDRLSVGSIVNGKPVLGRFSDWPALPAEVGFIAPKVKEMLIRSTLIRELGIPASRWVAVVDPRASVASDVSLAHGTSVGAHATIMPAARVGAHVAIRAGSVIAHDTVLGDYSYVGPNAVLCGYVQVDEGAHIAPGALVLERVRIGRFAVVGLGAVVLHDLPEFAVAVGNPAYVAQEVPSDIEDLKAK